MILRELIDEFRVELNYDFRNSYGLSLYEAVNGSICVREFFDLVQGLMSTPGTKVRASRFEVEEFSVSDFLLIRVHNAIIAGLDAKPADKKKNMITPKKPKSFNKELPKRRQITLEEKKKRIRVAAPGEIVFKYHVDKKDIVRKCKKNGIDCLISELHFDNKRQANRFKELSNGANKNS